MLTQDSPELAKFNLAEFLQTLRNPRFMDPEQTGPILLIGMIGDNEVNFWASPTDSMDYGRDIYRRVLNGEYGEIEPYREPEPPEDPQKEIETKKELF